MNSTKVRQNFTFYSMYDILSTNEVQKGEHMGNKYPLSFAVFYQSIIKHCSNYNQFYTVHALFFGKIIDKNSFVDKISAGTISEYVKAKRPIRAERVEFICTATISELAEHIRIINIQDISYAVEAIKRLIAITDLSLDLKKKLTRKADQYSNKLEYIAEIFQMSVKVFRKLDLDDKQISELDAIWNGETENIGIGNADVKQNSKYTNNSDEVKFRAGFIDHVNDILREEAELSRKTLYFQGGSVECHNVLLPDDYDNLIRFLGKFLEKKGLVEIDFADFLTISGLNPVEKELMNGSLSLYRIMGDVDFCIKTVNDLPKQEYAGGVLINASIGKATEVQQLYDLFAEINLYFENAECIVGVNIDEEIPDKLVIVYLAVRYSSMIHEKVKVKNHRDSVLEQIEKEIKEQFFNGQQFSEQEKTSETPEYLKKRYMSGGSSAKDGPQIPSFLKNRTVIHKTEDDIEDMDDE